MHRQLPAATSRRGFIAAGIASAAAAGFAAGPARGQAGTPIKLPILVPLTGPLALEGASQRNGALLAVRALAGRITFQPEVVDTGGSADSAVTAWHRALREETGIAVVGPIFGPQMLALMPLAAERRLPLLTISGTARLADAGNPWFFRFFPSDEVVKVAHARYVVEKLGAKKPAVLFQTTAYGQSGRDQLARTFTSLGVTPVFEEGITPTTTDPTATVRKAIATGPDVLVLHLHADSTAKVVNAARAIAPKLPIVAGSAMHQPATAKLVPAAELDGVCAETAASPVSADAGAEKAFLDAYRAQFNDEPDAFALAQYDAVLALAKVALDLRGAGKAVEPESVRQALASEEFPGIAMSYRSDGRGNMAHEATIVCYQGSSRIPRIAEKYSLRR